MDELRLKSTDSTFSPPYMFHPTLLALFREAARPEGGQLVPHFRIGFYEVNKNKHRVEFNGILLSSGAGTVQLETVRVLRATLMSHVPTHVSTLSRVCSGVEREREGKEGLEGLRLMLGFETCEGRDCGSDRDT